MPTLRIPEREKPIHHKMTRLELIDEMMDTYTEKELTDLGISFGLTVENVSMVLLADRIFSRLFHPGKDWK